MSSHVRRAHLEERPRISEIRFAVHENKLDDPSRVTDADYIWFSENPGIRTSLSACSCDTNLFPRERALAL
jgi:hypothetical protein